MSQPLKAQFQRLRPNGSPSGPPLPVMYNPAEFTLNKSAQIAEVAIPGLDSPVLQFVRGQTETLSLDLFFDTTEYGVTDNVRPVTQETDKFYQLVKIDSQTHAPPILLFSWGGQDFPGHRSYPSMGNQQRYGFKCIVENIRQRFTLFSPKGTPLRATLSVTLREYKTLSEQLEQLNLQSPDHTRDHVVRQGETLSRIAAQVYDDPKEWRRIADANELDDPLALQPGMILEIPPVE
ncbi:MAG: LysM peptidoglycan-binding domain-containing protein [Chloroflexota bacterium]